MRKNLAKADEITENATDWQVANATDFWSLHDQDTDKTVSGAIELKYKVIDAKNDVRGPMYYVVTLQESIRHFFLPGWFAPMDAKFKAVVLLRPHDTDLVSTMQELERTMVIDNWEYQNYYKGTHGAYAGKWNHYKSGTDDNNSGVNYYGGVYRTETVRITPSEKNSDGQKTKANTVGATQTSQGSFYLENEVDSINLDFQAELKVKRFFSSDWDLGETLVSKLANFSSHYHVDRNNSWSTNNGADKRILYNAEFNTPFKTRDESKTADPLWVRIESEPIIPMKKNYVGKDVLVYNSVRQITLNFNSDNSTQIPSGENKGNYMYRPYVLFYTGPENVDYATDSDGVLIRRSKPVVINLNAALNAIIYMPESPVIINGNGHKWTGFIIAKCFLRPVTADEVQHGGSIELFDGFKKKSFVGDFETEGTDSKGNTVYVKKKNLLTKTAVEADVTANYSSGEITTVTETDGNILIKEEVQAPKYLVLSFTEDDFKDCDTAEKFYTKFFELAETKSKANLKAFSNLTDEQITAVTMPDENYNFTAAKYYVANTDLLDNDPDGNPGVQNDKYVKVLLADGTEKFVDKTKLPYVKIRRNKNYFFACVYDLKNAWKSKNDVKTYSGVRIIDDSISEADAEASYSEDRGGAHNSATQTAADVFINNEDLWYDSWGIDNTLLDNVYKNNYTAAKMDFVEKNGIKYFMLKSEVAALPKEPQVVDKYYKITVGNETFYIKEGTEYYTRIDSNNDKNVTNHIILDKDGNILTRPITAPEVLGVNTVSANGNLEKQINDGNGSLALIEYWNKYTRATNSDEKPGDDGTTNDNDQYIGKDDNRKTKDYRIPALERVYYARLNDPNDGFNLSSASGYSYFQIPSLWRTNYKYLNVDETKHTVNGEPSDKWHVEDMFFTTQRAEWVD